MYHHATTTHCCRCHCWAGLHLCAKHGQHFSGRQVRWTWATTGHSVTSGTPCIPNGQFCSPDNMNCQAGALSNIGTVYEHTFTQAGTYSYFCHAHCEYGMSGVVIVGPRGNPPPEATANSSTAAITKLVSAWPPDAPNRTARGGEMKAPSVDRFLRFRVQKRF